MENEHLIYWGKKNDEYFSKPREKFVDELPLNANGRLLEIGCGSGETSAYAKKTGKCGWCAGIEICSGPASEASRRMDQVIVGDVEKIKLPFPKNYFDSLILSEVLEHLVDPWGLMKTIRYFLSDGAVVMAGSPNVSYKKVVRELIMGRWFYESTGIMDITHLRWFTPSSYKKMFEDSGFDVVSCGPAFPIRKKAKLFNVLTYYKFEHLLYPQIALKGICRH